MALLQHQASRTRFLRTILVNDKKADGIVITPSHNPPQDGGIKYNPTHGGPAEAELTQAIEDRANVIYC